MMTFGDAEKMFQESLAGVYDPEEARVLASITLGHLSGLTRSQLLVNRHQALSPETESSLVFILDDLRTGKPLQYILGETEFYGLRFFVDSSVLIPRPETEELVHWILQVVSSNRSEYHSLLDIGTGSGCIPVAVKKHAPELTVTAVDISFAAIETALRNAVLNQTAITFRQMDILESPGPLTGKFSIIVSNPPYITDREKEQMHPNVLEHEPHTALFVGDTDPLLFYRRISEIAISHLEPNGWLFFEINEYLGEETVSLLMDKGFRSIELKKDLNGRDRMIKASRGS
jgi:release factor glutamine methyltransferase